MQARQILRMADTPRSTNTEGGFSVLNVRVQRRGRQDPRRTEAMLDVGLITGTGRPRPLPLFLLFRTLLFLRIVAAVGKALRGRPLEG